MWHSVVGHNKVLSGLMFLIWLVSYQSMILVLDGYLNREQDVISQIHVLAHLRLKFGGKHHVYLYFLTPSNYKYLSGARKIICS